MSVEVEYEFAPEEIASVRSVKQFLRGRAIDDISEREYALLEAWSVNERKKKAESLPKTEEEIEKWMDTMPLFAEHRITGSKEHDELYAAIDAINAETSPEERAESFKSSGNEAFKLVKYIQGTLAKEQDPKQRGAFKRKLDQRFQDSIVYYTQGLDVGSKDKQINSVLYSNRALVYFTMGEYGHCKQDCAVAVRLNPGNWKAYYRFAQACQALKQWEAGIKMLQQCLDNMKIAAATPDSSFPLPASAPLEPLAASEPASAGSAESSLATLSIDTQPAEAVQQSSEPSADLIAHRKKRAEELQQQINLTQQLLKQIESANAADVAAKKAADAAKAAAAEAGMAARQKLMRAIQQRGIKFAPPNFKKAAAERGQADPYVDDEGSLHWPVLFLYPEKQTSDFVQDCHEDTRFSDLLANMFPPLQPFADWDPEKRYFVRNLELWYEVPCAAGVAGAAPSAINGETARRVLVDPSSTVAAVLRSKDYLLPQTPTFLITPVN